MKDKNLSFWTTSPNVFLVASSPIMPDIILGCISYKKIDRYTIEMNRLAVDTDFRGMKIGQKLVQALIDMAKENGYENMYLETSGPIAFRWDAICLYEKMGFEYLRSKNFGWPVNIFALLTNLKVVSYIYRIQ